MTQISLSEGATTQQTLATVKEVEDYLLNEEGAAVESTTSETPIAQSSGRGAYRAGSATSAKWASIGTGSVMCAVIVAGDMGSRAARRKVRPG